MIVALLTGVLIGSTMGGGGSSESLSSTSTKNEPLPEFTRTAEPTPSVDVTFSEPEPEPQPEADPDADYTTSCDYLLNFSDDLQSSDHRFVAEAEIENTGNIGIVVRVKATWDQIGAKDITQTKTTKLRYGQSKSVEFDRRASSDEIDRHQSADGDCKVKATIVDTFGAAR